MTFKAPRPMRIATLPMGYADGYWRRLAEGRAEVLVAGKRCSIVGRISMNMITVDVTHVPAAPGDLVTLLGSQGSEQITAEELAQKSGTLGYEICCGIGAAAHHRRAITNK